MKQRRAFPMQIHLPIDIEQGNSGLFYITSPLVKGLLVTGRTKREALDEVYECMIALCKACMLDELRTKLEATEQ